MSFFGGFKIYVKGLVRNTLPKNYDHDKELINILNYKATLFEDEEHPNPIHTFMLDVMNIIINEYYIYISQISKLLIREFDKNQNTFLSKYEDFYTKIYDSSKLLNIITKNLITLNDNNAIPFTEAQYLSFFKGDVQVLDFMKKLIDIGDKESSQENNQNSGQTSVFNYTYVYGLNSGNSFPYDFFNTLWLYFILNNNKELYQIILQKQLIIYSENNLKEYNPYSFIESINTLEKWQNSKIIRPKSNMALSLEIRQLSAEKQQEKLNENTIALQKYTDFKAFFKNIIDVSNIIVSTLKEIAIKYYNNIINLPPNEYVIASIKFIENNNYFYQLERNYVDDMKNILNEIFILSSFDKIESIIKSFDLNNSLNSPENSNIQDIQNIGILYEKLRIDSNPIVINRISDYIGSLIVQEGALFIKKMEEVAKSSEDKKEPLFITYVNTISELINKYNIIETTISKKNADLIKKISNSLSITINKNINKVNVVSILSNYINYLLTAKHTLDLNKEFNKIINIFVYIDNKDEFKINYIRGLSRRLLENQDSLNIENEELLYNIITKQQGSSEYHEPLEMIKTYKTSQDEINKFKQSLTYEKIREEKGIDFAPRVLKKIGFEVDTKDTFIPPPEIKDIIDEFVQDYKIKNGTERKKIEFIYKNSPFITEFIGKNNKKFFITCSMYQGTILYLMDAKENKTISIDELMEKTNLSFTSLLLSLEPLVKIGLIIKNDRNYTINTEFDNEINKGRVKIILRDAISIEKQSKIEKEDKEAIKLNKDIFIDAVIVRKMKSSKTVNYEDLTGFVFLQTKGRYTITNDDIKRRIETLVDREYIRRDDENRNLFHYIA